MKVLIPDKELNMLLKNGQSKKFYMHTKDKSFMQYLSSLYSLMQICDNIDELIQFKCLEINKEARNIFRAVVITSYGTKQIEFHCEENAFILDNILSNERS